MNIRRRYNPEVLPDSLEPVVLMCDLKVFRPVGIRGAATQRCDPGRD